MDRSLLELADSRDMTKQEELLLETIIKANPQWNILHPKWNASDKQPWKVLIEDDCVVVAYFAENAKCTFQTLCAVGEFFNTDHVNLVKDSEESDGTCCQCNRFAYALKVYPDRGHTR